VGHMAQVEPGDGEVQGGPAAEQHDAVQLAAVDLGLQGGQAAWHWASRPSRAARSASRQARAWGSGSRLTAPKASPSKPASEARPCARKKAPTFSRRLLGTRNTRYTDIEDLLRANRGTKKAEGGGVRVMATPPSRKGAG